MLCHYQGRPQVHSRYWGATPPSLQMLQQLAECAEKQVFTNFWETWIWIQSFSLDCQWKTGSPLSGVSPWPFLAPPQLSTIGQKAPTCSFMEPKEVRTDPLVRRAHQEHYPSNSWRLNGRHRSCVESDCRPSNSCPSWNFWMWPYWEVCPLQIQLVKLGWGHTGVKWALNPTWLVSLQEEEETRIDIGEECQVTVEAKTGVVYPQAEQWQGWPTTSETEKQGRI